MQKFADCFLLPLLYFGLLSWSGTAFAADAPIQPLTHKCCVPNQGLCTALVDSIETMSAQQEIPLRLEACKLLAGSGKNRKGELQIVAARLLTEDPSVKNKVSQDVTLTCDYACRQQEFRTFPPRCVKMDWNCTIGGNLAPVFQ